MRCKLLTEKSCQLKQFSPSFWFTLIPATVIETVKEENWKKPLFRICCSLIPSSFIHSVSLPSSSLCWCFIWSPSLSFSTCLFIIVASLIGSATSSSFFSLVFSWMHWHASASFSPSSLSSPFVGLDSCPGFWYETLDLDWIATKTKTALFTCFRSCKTANSGSAYSSCPSASETWSWTYSCMLETHCKDVSECSDWDHIEAMQWNFLQVCHRFLCLLSVVFFLSLTLVRPICMRMTWSCSIDWSSSQLVTERNDHAKYDKALCSEFLAQGCSKILGCCPEDDFLLDYVENNIYQNDFPKPLLPSPSCPHDPKNIKDAQDLCKKCKGMKVKLKAESRCKFPVPGSPSLDAELKDTVWLIFYSFLRFIWCVFLFLSMMLLFLLFSLQKEEQECLFCQASNLLLLGSVAVRFVVVILHRAFSFFFSLSVLL